MITNTIGSLWQKEDHQQQQQQLQDNDFIKMQK
jgi:hypothetical protein